MNSIKQSCIAIPLCGILLAGRSVAAGDPPQAASPSLQQGGQDPSQKDNDTLSQRDGKSHPSQIEDYFTLLIGDPAPDFKPMKWIKGKPITQFEKQHVYVLDFWATWCEPCMRSMPKLSAIAHRFKDQITVIGVNMGEDEGAEISGTIAAVEKTVKKMGDKMNYAVAMDSPKERTVAKTWYRPAGFGSIPALIVIDGQGRLAWTGNSTDELGKIIPQVLNNTIDSAQALANQQKMAQRIALMRKRQNEGFYGAVNKALERKDYAAALYSADSTIAMQTGHDDQQKMAAFKVLVLLHIDTSLGIAYARHQLEDEDFLNRGGNLSPPYKYLHSLRIAQDVAAEDGLTEQAYEFALELGRWITDQYPGEAPGWQALASAYHRLGQNEKAIVAQQTAIAIAEHKKKAIPENWEKDLDRYRSLSAQAVSQ